MKVRDLKKYLDTMDDNFEIVVGLNTDYHEIDDIETSYENGKYIIWIKE